MPTEREAELYFQARDHALTRLVEKKDFSVQLQSYYTRGLLLATGLTLFDHLFSELQPETNSGFAIVCALLTRLEAVKGKHYQASWMKRGELGVLPNLQRKFDRIDAIMGSVSDDGENLTQTLGDLAVYTIKWLALRAQIAPEEFRRWTEEISDL